MAAISPVAVCHAAVSLADGRKAKGQWQIWQLWAPKEDWLFTADI